MVLTPEVTRPSCRGDGPWGRDLAHEWVSALDGPAACIRKTTTFGSSLLLLATTTALAQPVWLQRLTRNREACRNGVASAGFRAGLDARSSALELAGLSGPHAFAPSHAWASCIGSCPLFALLSSAVAASLREAETQPNGDLTLAPSLLPLLLMKAIGAGICFCLALLFLLASGSNHPSGPGPGSASGATGGKVLLVGAWVVAGVSLLSANRKATAWQGSGIVVMLMALAGLGAEWRVAQPGGLWPVLVIECLVGILGLWLFRKGRQLRHGD